MNPFLNPIPGFLASCRSQFPSLHLKGLACFHPAYFFTLISSYTPLLLPLHSVLPFTYNFPCYPFGVLSCGPVSLKCYSHFIKQASTSLGFFTGRNLFLLPLTGPTLTSTPAFLPVLGLAFIRLYGCGHKAFFFCLRLGQETCFLFTTIPGVSKRWTHPWRSMEDQYHLL